MAKINCSVEIEEPIYTYTEANNGAGPFWCMGNSCIVRYGDDVFVSGVETLKNVKPLNNLRWLLFKREETGWRLQIADEERQREPCPLAIFSDGRLLLSTNPTLTVSDVREGPANPHLLQFQADDLSAPPVALQPVWDHNPGFGEHSYRGIGVDGENHELAIFNNYGYDEQYWAFLNRHGEWENRGIINYPLRCCYQNIALKNGVCHIQAVSDIVETNPEWRAWKKDFYQKEWDYVFRRLFYYYNPNLAREQFLEPIEIENVDATAGHLRNLDLWIAPDGAAHLLYLKKSVGVPEMRDVFFPGVPLTTSLEYCIIAEDKIVHRRTLLSGGENLSNELPIEARLHETPDGRLLMIYATQDVDNPEGVKNYLMEIIHGECASPIPLPLRKPFTNFMSASPRNGCLPNEYIDLYGATYMQSGLAKLSTQDELRYVRIRLR